MSTQYSRSRLKQENDSLREEVERLKRAATEGSVDEVAQLRKQNEQLSSDLASLRTAPNPQVDTETVENLQKQIEILQNELREAMAAGSQDAPPQQEDLKAELEKANAVLQETRSAAEEAEKAKVVAEEAAKVLEQEKMKLVEAKAQVESDKASLEAKLASQSEQLSKLLADVQAQGRSHLFTISGSKQ